MGFVSDRMQIPGFALSKETAVQALHQNVSEDLIRQFHETIDSCDLPGLPEAQAIVTKLFIRKESAWFLI